VVIDDREILDEITTFHPYADMLREAPLAILVCGDLKLEAHKGFWVQDCSAATQNILLAAHAKGLGAVWLAFYPKEDRCDAINRLLGIPEHVMPLALIAIGYPGEKKPPAERYSTAKVHHNRW
jgi:nitroreductase